MVCDRCIKVISDELAAQEIELLEIELGRIKINVRKGEEKKKLIQILDDNGFLLITNAEEQLVEQVKIELIKILQTLPVALSQNLSAHLAENLHTDYSKISKVFSYNEGITIEKYFIKLKIEKVKELMQNEEHNFTEISQLLDYKHINHLSRQFKRETGMSLSNYKIERSNFRNTLDQIR